MSLGTAKKAIDLFAEPGDKLKIQLTGGEPLLCAQLMADIFRYVKAQGIQTAFSIQTNGTAITKEICKLLAAMRCAVGVSLDGINEANGLRVYPDGKPAIDDALAGIKLLGMAGINCNINAVVTRVNQNRLSELMDLAAMLGNVRGVGLDMFRPIGRGEENDFSVDINALPKDLETMLQRRMELNELGVDIRIKELEKVRRMLKTDVEEDCYCYAQKCGVSVAVDPQGDIYPCSSFVGMPRMKMGNVRAGELIPADVPKLDEECKKCAEAKICRGGCPAGRVACGGKNLADCIMHRSVIAYGRNEYA